MLVDVGEVGKRSCRVGYMHWVGIEDGFIYNRVEGGE